MSRSLISHAMTTFADDALYHLTGFAQSVFDVATVVALGLVVFVTSAHPGHPVLTPAVLTPPQVATNCAMALLADSCITAQVLQSKDS